MQDVQTVQAEILLKDSSKMLYYTSHCQMCDLNKQINTLLSLIFNSYLNSVTKKKRSNNVQADEWPFTTGATKHWDIPGALLLPSTAFFTNQLTLIICIESEKLFEFLKKCSLQEKSQNSAYPVL